MNWRDTVRTPQAMLKQLFALSTSWRSLQPDIDKSRRLPVLTGKDHRLVAAGKSCFMNMTGNAR
jgi:hypothetical protein